MEKRGQSIPGSKFVRDFSDCCGEPIRVEHVGTLELSEGKWLALAISPSLRNTCSECSGEVKNLMRESFKHRSLAQKEKMI